MGSKTTLRIIGGLLGLIGPPIALFIFYYFNYSELAFSEFINRLVYTTLFAPMMSLSVLVNLFLFFCFIWINKDEGAQGVLFVTILYAFWIFGMKLF